MPIDNSKKHFPVSANNDDKPPEDTSQNNKPANIWITVSKFTGGLLLLLALLALIQYLRPKPLKDMSGIYFTDGGSYYIELEFSQWFGIQYKSGNVSSLFESLQTSNRISINKEDDGLIRIKQNARLSENSNDSYISVNLSLEKSSQTEDWDLIEGHGEAFDKFGKPDIPSNFEEIPEFLKAYYKHWFSPYQSITKLSREANRPPIISFLHRMNDDRLPLYFQTRLEKENEFALKLIREIHQKHPKDIYVRLHLLEMETRFGDLQKVVLLEKQWRQSLSNSNDLIFQEQLQLVNHELKHRIANMKNVNASTLIWEISGDGLTLNQKIGKLKELIPYEIYLEPNIPMIRNYDEIHSIMSFSSLNYLEINTIVKISQIISLYYLFEGNKEQTLELQAATYHLGQLMNSEGDLIARLIGLATRSISIQGLQTIIFNGPPSTDYLEQSWQTLEQLEQMPEQATCEKLYDGEPNTYLNYADLQFDFIKLHAGSNRQEAITRHKVADSKFQVLRAGTAALHRFYSTGDFPTTVSEFAPLLPHGLPADPFTTKSLPLRFVNNPEPEPFVVYSIGPDGLDDDGSIRYDTTNGTVSRGDVLIRVPRKRIYPFPEDGCPVRAKNAEDLLQQFPNGLPTDLFSEDRNTPLSILDASSTHPLTIFSWGPDRNQQDVMGINSNNNSRRLMPNPFALDPSATRLQYVLQPDLRSPSEHNIDGIKTFQPGTYTLQPYYDSTNGTNSLGDLYLKILPPE